MTPIVWPIRSYDPRNRIGKYALQDIHDWKDRSMVRVEISYGKTPDNDVILVVAVPTFAPFYGASKEVSL